MRVVFFGTPAIAVPSLERVLESSHEVVAVVSQPDKPRGRGRSASASPVKSRAIEAGIDVLQPGTPKEDGFAESLAARGPEALAVVAYGHILPRPVLSVAPAMNVHFSLLPRYRGAAPVQRALMDGVDRTGVSVFLLEPTVDTGPIIAREAIEVGPEETAGDVFDRLAPIGARLLVESLDALERGTATPQEQADAEASPAPKIKPEETAVDWTVPAEQIVNLIRGLSPSPGAHTRFRGKRLNLRRARIAGGRPDGDPGTVASPAPFAVHAGRGTVELVEIQLEGKRWLQGEEFARGQRLKTGDLLDQESNHLSSG